MSRALPDVAEILGPLLARIAPEQRPLLMALAERMAADRYRAWAADVSDPEQRRQLLACADREDEIAGLVEALHENAPAVQADIRAKLPELPEINRSVFAGRPVADQYTIQSRGERVGALTWRALAESAEPEARETFLACAELEERSAEVLDAILGGRA